MIGYDEHRRFAGKALEDAPDQTVDVLERPVRLRRAGTVEVLEAVDAEEVHEQQIGRVTMHDVRGEASHHRVLHEALRELRPLALTIHGVAKRGELLPHHARRLRLEHALILEERQIEVERAGVARRRPVDGGRAHSCCVGTVVYGRRAQQIGRVVDGIAGEIFRRARPAVQDVIGDDAVDTRAHPGHEARVRGPRRAREHGLHAGGDGAPLGEAAQRGQTRLWITPVEGREPVDADHDDAVLRHGLSLEGHGTRVLVCGADVHGSSVRVPARW